MKTERINSSEESITALGAMRSAVTMVDAGAILIVVRSGILKHSLPVAINDVVVTLNQDMKAVFPIDSRLLSGFFQRLIQGHNDQLLHLWRKQGATVESLETDLLTATRFALPPLDEQRAIAAFLDRETAKIDALIAEQERLIALLQEKRQAVISQAVTKGLDPTVPMKDSGVEWLGDVPAHWEVMRLKYLGESIIGLTYSPADICDEGEGKLVLRSSNIQSGKIVFNDNVYVSTPVPSKLDTQIGDILICSRNGSRALIGKNAMIDGDSAGNTFGAFMTIFRSGCNKYLFWVLNSSLFEFQSGAYMTSTINQLTVGVLNNFPVPLPPPEEREEIAAFIKDQTKEIDALTDEVQRGIVILRERRSALISAAVTGKIDVREAVGAEPAEAA